MKKTVEELALSSAKNQGILNDERLSDVNDDYFGKPQEYANHRCSIYMCHECNNPYFGGLRDCE